MLASRLFITFNITMISNNNELERGNRSFMIIVTILKTSSADSACFPNIYLYAMSTTLKSSLGT